MRGENPVKKTCFETDGCCENSAAMEENSMFPLPQASSGFLSMDADRGANTLHSASLSKVWVKSCYSSFAKDFLVLLLSSVFGGTKKQWSSGQRPRERK